MGNVRDILKSKDNPLVTVSPYITVFEALEKMVEKNIGALLVTENEKLTGILTERDYARKVILQGKTSKETRVNEVMTQNLITVSPDNTLEDCMQYMTNKFIRHLPVVENDKLIGIVSIGDVVKYIINEQRYIIEHLEHYIKGR
ncbi:MAG: CBS domain-containing protein [Bacteroidota bacterium]|nr:CBS domain-containing protein [Bacteroidota bacterium]